MNNGIDGFVHLRKVTLSRTAVICFQLVDQVDIDQPRTTELLTRLFERNTPLYCLTVTPKAKDATNTMVDGDCFHATVTPAA